MRSRNWLPTSWLGHKEAETPFAMLRDRIETLFDDFGEDMSLTDRAFAMNSDVSETDSAITVTAELPGMTEKDITVSVSGNRLTIEGEKNTETASEGDEGEAEKRAYHRIERYSGSFRRVMTLPFEVDPDSIKAEMKDGVLTVSLPKPAEAMTLSRKIEVKHAA
ncbi:Hsp20/alpha crystallin family protein [Celeribacter neptunius]|uniref:HSP20 family protein n=1 Tax=Celeribacter neptunius TaxID=588602 RepID=A0A1I3KCU2_9RHOB|nr:Hsp20/alpha crystallin family protein [Celeribacter neptunius]SFI70341.1 HSP20 family protein [Celeribacter neptunius]